MGRSEEREHRELYTTPLAYDIAFDVRDTGRECDFMLAVAQRLLGRPVRSALELASGPGYHALELARRDLRSVALDIEPAMVAWLEGKARARGLQVDVRRGDMRTFELEPPVDLAFNLFGSFGYLLTNEDIRAHLEAVHRALEPKGVYVLELQHPRRYLRHDQVTQDQWTRERDGVRVTTRWDIDASVPDPLTQVADIRSEFEVIENGRRRRIRTRGRQRVLFAQELCALVEAGGHFRVAEWFGAMDRKIRFDYSRSAWRMVAILQRT